MLYIGRPKICTINADQEESRYNAKLTTPFTPGIIIPSQNIIAYINYTSQSGVENSELLTSKNYEYLISRVPDILHWESIITLTYQQFLHNAVTIMDPKSDRAFFIAKVDNLISQEDKAVGHCSGANFSFDFSCPLFGLGTTETRFSRSESDSYLDALKALVLYDGTIFEVTKFSVLCCYSIPKLCHHTFPELKWEMVSDDSFPPKAFPAGVTPNGEILYVGRTQYSVNVLAPGYIVPSEKCLHLRWGHQEFRYDNKYEVLKLENEDILEWGMYCRGEIPPNAAAVGYFNNEKIFIGRIVIDGDISLGRTWSHGKINLPEDVASNTQLVGTLLHNYECLYVPWDSKEYLYQLYEVLMVKMRPKSLQQLCRNAIITATLGIPGRVDKLSIPKHLKEYCKTEG